MSPPFSTTAWDDPSSTSLSAMWTATAPATPAIGPTPATTDASHMRLTRSSSPGDAGYGSYVMPKNGSSEIFDSIE